MICSSVCPFLGILPPSAFVQRTTSGCRTQPPSCLIFGFWVKGAPAALDLRGYYIGAYVEDSCRVSHNLTVNVGVRWEATPFWSDNKNRNPDLVLGLQSQVFPTAPTGYVFPGDP